MDNCADDRAGSHIEIVETDRLDREIADIFDRRTDFGKSLLNANELDNETIVASVWMAESSLNGMVHR